MITTDEVHVWFASLDEVEHCAGRWNETLSDDEQSRAERLRFELDRQRFRAARGLLRAILGRYLDVEPGRLEFRYGSSGKPRLGGVFAGSDVRFNVSHCAGRALYAVASHREVGVDLERVRVLDEYASIAGRFFSVRERQALDALPADLRIRGFFDCWTRKEAYIKATGDGLSHPLDRFHVSLDPGVPARLLAIDGDPDGASRWWLMGLEPDPNHVGAVAAAMEGGPPTLRKWLFSVTMLERGRA